MNFIRIVVAIHHDQLKQAFIHSLRQENEQFLLYPINDLEILQKTIQENSITHVILDSELETTKQFSLIKELTQNSKPLTILILAPSLDSLPVNEFIHAGATIVLPYSIDIEKLAKLLH